MNAPIVQGSAEWHALRLGKVTASRVSDVLAEIKSGEAASRANYRAELIAERLTGVAAESFANAAMQWGTEQEPFARAAYEVHANELVDQIGFIDHPRIDMSGASPDGLVGKDGLVEFKCPTTSNHVATLISGAVPSKYVPQMAWQMACTGRKWCDFCSYDPRLPEDLRLFVKRVDRDDKYIAELEAEVEKFLEEVTGTINLLRKAA